MDSRRKRDTPEYKLKVVLESMQRDTTQEDVCKKFEVSSSMLHCWKKEFQSNAESVFQAKRDPKQKAQSQGFCCKNAGRKLLFSLSLGDRFKQAGDEGNLPGDVSFAHTSDLSLAKHA